MNETEKLSAPPASIWLQYWGDAEPREGATVCLGDVTWSKKRMWPHDVEYVRKDNHAALVEALDGILKAYDGGGGFQLVEAIKAAQKTRKAGEGE